MAYKDVNRTFHALPLIAGLCFCGITGQYINAEEAEEAQEFEHRVMLGISEHKMIDADGNVFDLGANVEIQFGQEYETCVWLANKDFPDEEIVDFLPIEECLATCEAVALNGGQFFCISGEYVGEIFAVDDDLQVFETYKLVFNTHWSEEICDDDIYSYQDLETWELNKGES